MPDPLSPPGRVALRRKKFVVLARSADADPWLTSYTRRDVREVFHKRGARHGDRRASTSDDVDHT
ncbi:hypothetical protein Ae168Ps1_2635c [Pseudonocardia sp. Ae168_Ps1]|nr:hypothetical protein Ae168Ps1_2635c [Pseudonocardia sp. Ae168_Ps1]